jgi:hypothetical protein
MKSTYFITWLNFKNWTQLKQKYVLWHDLCKSPDFTYINTEKGRDVTSIQVIYLLVDLDHLTNDSVTLI